MRKSLLILGILSLILVLGWVGFSNRQTLREAYKHSTQEPIPAAVTYATFTTTPTTPPKKETTPPVKTEPPAPTQLNLKMPFVPQAPFKVWDAVHEDTCEEASMVMMQAYLNGETSLTTAEMDRRLLELVDYQNTEYGDFKSTDAKRVAEIMIKHLGIKGARVLPLSSPRDIERELRAGRPVLLPASGKALHNPNFKNGGPSYHMLVVKGFMPGKFITNDPGTRLGENYIYDEPALFDAVHDWNNGDVINGAKVMIVVEKL